MKTEYQYLTFVKTADKPKTSVWSCRNRHFGEELGTVQWDFGWRQYIYSPAVQAVYSAGCLSDIADFIQQLTAERNQVQT